MKFSLSWLKDHLDTTAAPAELSAALTMLGLEVESVTDTAAALAAFTTARIIAAAPHPDAARLQVCMVDSGTETLQIVCGAPNARAGLTVVLGRPGAYVPGLDVTLKKTAIRGVESHGMLCSARELELGTDGDGILELPDILPLGVPFAPLLGLDDPVFDIAITPNRGDCLSIRGVARDLAAAGFGTLKPWAAPALRADERNPYTIVIEDKTACPLFATRLLRGVKNGPSPSWLQQRLSAVGLRPVSALVDVTNYFAYHLGRPLHVFDIEMLSGTTLTINRTAGGETFRGLGEREVTLPEGAVVIRDEAGILSLAGILGGEHSACTETTTNVLLESALFEAAAIARTGQALGLLSDARSRFERGVDSALVLPVLDAAASLIQELCGGTLSAVAASGAAPGPAPVIPFAVEDVARLGGSVLAPERIQGIVERLGFVRDSAGYAPPSWRHDCTNNADVVEEVLRVHGYDHTPLTALPLHPSVTKHTRSDTVRQRLIEAGLCEAVTWSFTDSRILPLFGGEAPHTRLANPISRDLDVLRPSLLPNLLLAAQRNVARGVVGNGLFEVGAVFHGGQPGEQQRMAAAVLWGDAVAAHWTGGARPVDAFDGKALLQRLLERCGLSAAALPVSRDAPAAYHPGQSGQLCLGKTVVGRFGRLHPTVCRAFDLEMPVVALELFLEALPALKTKGKAALALSPYPPVERDFAFLVPEDYAVGTLLKAIPLAERTLIREVQVFDVYQGKGVPEGQKSVAVRVRLEPQNTTLDDAALSAVHSAIVHSAAKSGARLRPAG